MTSNNPLLEKISFLQTKFSDPAYQDDLEKINSWKKDAEDLILREELCENDTLQTILKKYSKEVEEMHESLMTGDSTVLPDSKRDRLMDKKRLYQDFILTFDVLTIRTSLESVDKEVSEELANLNS